MMDRGHQGAIDVADDSELIASLFATRVPAVIITLLFLMIGIIVTSTVADLTLDVLLAGGMVASIGRIAVMVAGGRALRLGPWPAKRVRAIERRFAIGYLAFAGILGTFCARAFVVVPVDQMVLIGIMMSGYAAGVASGVTLRPRIAVTAIMLAALPTAVVAALRLDVVGLAMAAMLLAFLGGGLRSMQMRYRSETGRIALRRTYERLARQDYLTGITNRLGLEQRYSDGAAVAPARCLVVHCLDLDGFKQLNDRHGHDVGDTLLIAVAARLGECPGETIAARLGGDEFVLVQLDMTAGDAGHALRSLEQRLSAPYPVDGRLLKVGVSIGTATGSTARPLRDLLREADLRQRQRKLERRRHHRARLRSGFGAPIDAEEDRIAALIL